MELELVDGGLNGRLFEELVQLVRREVGDSDVSDFAGVKKLFHGHPGLHELVSALCVEACEGAGTHVNVVNVVPSVRRRHRPVH